MHDDNINITENKLKRWSNGIRTSTLPRALWMPLPNYNNINFFIKYYNYNILYAFLKIK